MIPRTTPLLSTDGVVFNPLGQLLLIRRKNHPYKHFWALPGGFVELGEDTRSACVRELNEETGLIITPKNLTLVDVYSDPNRDPRGHVCSIAYYIPLKDDQTINAGDDAMYAEWVDLSKLPSLAFDHNVIVADAVRFCR